MLVGYSSSSSEEDEAECEKSLQQKDDELPAKKKLRTEEQASKKRLPLPGCLLTMFPDEEEPQTADSSLHGGRIRSFKHERGNWATYVYFPYHPEEDFMERLEELLQTAGAQGVVLTPQEEFHLSLSQTVVLKHHWIQPFTQSLRAGLARCRRFSCSAGKLKAYCNAEKTRTFLAMEVWTGHAQLMELVRVVDQTMTEFRLETFYEDPSFHVSLAWCVGDFSVQLKDCLQQLQSLVDEHEDGPFQLKMACSELRCRTGNKTFRFPLEST
ncbi:unnamed protein product [Ophioblennius macclurei]